MSIGGAVGLGKDLGMLGVELIVRYSKHEYDEKISELEGYAKKLEGHLSTLESYKNQVTTYWKDSRGEKLKASIEKEIKAVRNSLHRVEEFKKIYTETSESFGTMEKANDTVLDKIDSMLVALGIQDE